MLPSTRRFVGSFIVPDMIIRREGQKERADVMAAGRTVAKCSGDAEAKEKNGAGGGGGDGGARRSEVCQITEVRDINDS